MFAKAKKADLDLDALGEEMQVRKNGVDEASQAPQLSTWQKHKGRLSRAALLMCRSCHDYAGTHWPLELRQKVSGGNC